LKLELAEAIGFGGAGAICACANWRFERDEDFFQKDKSEDAYWGTDLQRGRRRRALALTLKCNLESYINFFQKDKSKVAARGTH
jgi:hypothetical protein